MRRRADGLVMNRRSFKRLFRRGTGMSFATWRQPGRGPAQRSRPLTL